MALLVYLGVVDSPPLLGSPPRSRCGKVRLRGRWGLELAGIAGRSARPGLLFTKGEGAVPESGDVKNGEVGLSGPGEKDDGAVSVNALFSEFVLCE